MTKILHLDIKHVTVHKLMIPRWHNAILKHVKGKTYISHFLLERLTPKDGTSGGVECVSFLDILEELHQLKAGSVAMPAARANSATWSG